MKQFLILIALVFIYVSCDAQTEGPAKLYGYKQNVTPGTNPNWNEGGKQRQVKTGTNYYIYLVTNGRAYPSSLWIEGTEYSASMKTINITPVETNNPTLPAAPSTVLVPKSTGNVIQLIPVPAIDGKSNAKAASMANDNEVIVVYKLNGKFYYNKLEKLSELPSAARQ
jgi:hypothetical protein